MDDAVRKALRGRDELRVEDAFLDFVAARLVLRRREVIG